jgi:RNA-directed DNA polymerase
LVTRAEQRGWITQLYQLVNQQWEELLDTAKPFAISKKIVWQAYLRVKASKGAAGVDDESIADFERDLKNNLYKIWNRMSSGSYFPPPVRTVSIPKSNGGTRQLGIPTVGDRIAQTVVKIYLEPKVEPVLHPDSYGYRPGRSAHDALAVARQRCWRNDWVVDLDIRGFFDNLDHVLLMRAVKKHTDTDWIILYIERWLVAPVQLPDGTLVKRDRGSPQGSVISPLLANIFLHHAFACWMQKEYPHIPFEYYADDVLVHCRTRRQANFLRQAIAERMSQCKLELHPEKTRIVYCKDDDRRGSHEHERFDFLGYTFRARRSKSKDGHFFVNFSPAISDKAAKAIRAEIRSWQMHQRADKSLDDLARMFNAKVQGWINYYGRFYKSAMYPTLRRLEEELVLWARRKHRRFKYHKTRAIYWLGSIARREPALFSHWKLGLRSPA